jgi:serine/threonine-protein kinase Chk2
VNPKVAISDEVEDEVKEGVWGYLVPLDAEHGSTLVMKKRSTCPKLSELDSFAAPGKLQPKNGNSSERDEQEYEKKVNDASSGGYLIGRHPECGMLSQTVIF